MLTHLFKLIWNKKKQNFLLIMEMLVSFLVMFAVFTLIVYYYQNYTRPRGFEFEKVWAVNYQSPQGMSDKDSIAAFNQSLKQLIKSMPQVENVSFAASNIPFSMSTHNTNVSHEKISEMAHIYAVDDEHKDVLNFNLRSGRWFSRADQGSRETAAVINADLAQKFFGNGQPIGKTIDFEGKKLKVTGVIDDIKDKGDYQGPDNNLFIRIDTSNQAWIGAILVKVKPTADAAFESRLFKSLSNVIRNSSIEIEHLADKRVTKNNLTLVPMIILLVVAGFLIINVALGLFGVLWYNISKRKGEIGLRRAVGASGGSVSKQLVTEALILSTLSLIIGLFFAVQFPLMNVFDLAADTYYIAIACAVAFIYLLVIICSLYPGRQAASIYPAVALHEE
ncbi:MAG: ABC transporter permease [Bacteroidota bacterium]|nr:ABC transporter permease [Ferruginibacter sp.]